MNQHDEMKFAEVMATIGAAFSKPITDTQLDIYFDCLREYDIETVTWAAKWILKNRTITGTFPLISEFVQAIENKDGTQGDRAEHAWRKLLWTIETVGHVDSVTFDDLCICSTVKALGGWLHVCSAADPFCEDWYLKNLEWRRKDFIAMYKSLAGRGEHEPFLIGLSEADCRNRGYDPPDLIMITGNSGNYERKVVVRIDYQGQARKLLELVENVGTAFQ